MVEGPDHSRDEGLEPRPPTQADLVSLCGELNRLGARYVVIGGFAMIHAGYLRFTGDLDLLIDLAPENERRVLKAMETLPDKAASELKVGELAEYAVVRVADEILVDLMGNAGGIDYASAQPEVEIREVDGVDIPFASPRLLWRMKAKTHRERDVPDLMFLRDWFARRNEEPPSV